MTALFLILLASVIYFAVNAYALRDVEAKNLLTIELEKDPDGYHAAVIDLGEDAVLHVTDSFRAVEDAVKAAQAWIQANG